MSLGYPMAVAQRKENGLERPAGVAGLNFKKDIHKKGGTPRCRQIPEGDSNLACICGLIIPGREKERLGEARMQSPRCVNQLMTEQAAGQGSTPLTAGMMSPRDTLKFHWTATRALEAPATQCLLSATQLLSNAFHAPQQL